ncbi:sodium-dependent transporter [Corynebacterium sp. zg254]|uniref:Transporter n=1 Tax=Corynebacterium zhongnanshanii TaxID=2768834 RepID=A0ABQ6VFF6_9CORY|nr:MULTISPECIES: sodium-dependent transporter [Corynebacterium]KAB3523140.1 sodium-dependent transporter [Corynebacterium zhongnanshanii]MCR5913754.1 sodium-dependent transporter [Corynebacterium sp. zg254]
MTSSTENRARNTRATFNTRLVFLMAAIGSAVGLGNIWRFPYVAYDNGGGAFLIPYLVALLTAGIPLLWFDLAFGHRFRGSAPLAFRRLNRYAEPIGWFKAGVNFFIAIYYAAIIAWALLYTIKSINKAWGTSPDTHFSKEFLRADTGSVFSGEFVVPVLITMVIVWIICILALATDINKGIGKVSSLFIPVLLVLFLILVVRALFLDGALEGLNAFFTPNWSALSNPSVWIAAYSQIFFSLSIGFGIMITYASYLKPRTNLTNTGMVTAFANSSFEVLAGIGVFAVLGFMAQQQGVPVSETVSSGIGLAFVAFPTIINEMPFGEVFGVFFFGSLFLAGVTSLISIMEVVISAVADKFDLTRRTAALAAGSVMAVISCILFSVTSGLATLDIVDKFTNNLGIVIGAVAAVLTTGWILGRRNEMEQHINAVSSVRVGPVWQACVFVITPLVLIYFLAKEIMTLIDEPYEGYSSGQLLAYGWGAVALIFVASIVFSLLAYRGNNYLNGLATSDFGVPIKGRKRGEPNLLVAAAQGAGAASAAEAGTADADSSNAPTPKN